MTKKVHPALPQALERKLRKSLEDKGISTDGVYVYLKRTTSQESTTPPLSEEDKRKIRNMVRAKKASVVELAQLYGKSRQAIYNVLKELPDE
tara:strand:+ start:531 stop:806 length:276 start_codon:yes stop_codon:yes gene_type:complete